MKILCKKCGKKYDYDLYGGLCPKCGTFYKQWEDREDIEELIGKTIYAQSTESVQPANLAGQQKMNHQQQNVPKGSIEKKQSNPTQESMSRPKKKSGFYRVVTIFLLAWIIYSIASPIKKMYLTNKIERKAMTLENLEKPQKIKMGEAFSYQSNTGTYDITITSVAIDKDSALDVPDGYEMITVSYHCVETEKKIQNKEDNVVEKEANPLCAGIYMKPYLMTKEGVYLSPMSVHEIKEKMGWDDDVQNEVGLSTQFEYQDGLLYYVVKVDEIKAIWISSFDQNKEDSGSGVLRESIKITNLKAESSDGGKR